MSAPTTHDPRFVNTKDGVCWERRTVTDSGLGLYAVEGSCKCPPFKMATLAELAAHGIVEWADVLPMPVGAGPQPLPADRLAEIRSLDLLALMSDRAAPVISGHLAALLAEVTRLRAERAAIGDEIARFGIFGAALPATKALVKRADELVTENASLRSQVAELNEFVSSAAEELRARQSCPCPPADQPGPHQVGCFFDGVPVSPPSERPVNGLTAKFMPVAAYREDPHDSPLYHDYKGPGRDFPETGGAL